MSFFQFKKIVFNKIILLKLVYSEGFYLVIILKRNSYFAFLKRWSNHRETAVTCDNKYQVKHLNESTNFFLLIKND